MILLDTNVVSEPLKASCDKNVLSWIDEQVIETLYLSTISLAELRFTRSQAPAFSLAKLELRLRDSQA